jgi:transcriptional regulator with XRE-family HTH domain
VHEAKLKQVGLTIRHLREERGFTQEGFAHFAQIARTFYGRVERGEQNLELKTLFHLAEHLKVHPAELLKDISVDGSLRSAVEGLKEP